jgi:hypothetical protein
VWRPELLSFAGWPGASSVFEEALTLPFQARGRHSLLERVVGSYRKPGLVGEKGRLMAHDLSERTLV